MVDLLDKLLAEDPIRGCCAILCHEAADEIVRLRRLATQAKDECDKAIARANEGVEREEWAASRLAPVLGVYAHHAEPFNAEDDALVWQIFVDYAKTLRLREQQLAGALLVAKDNVLRLIGPPVEGSPEAEVIAGWEKLLVEGGVRNECEVKS